MTNIAVIQLICLHINGSIFTFFFSIHKNLQQGQMIKDGFTVKDIFMTTETREERCQAVNLTRNKKFTATLLTNVSWRIKKYPSSLSDPAGLFIYLFLARLSDQSC